MRKTNEELQEIKEKYGVDTLWSWSRYNTYKSDPYAYLLKYIQGVKEDRTDSIYAVSGGTAHDILERYYNGTIEQSQMLGEYEDNLMMMNLSELKYDRNDSDKNEAIALKYESCLKHFFKYHHKPENLKMSLEMFCLIKITDDILFNGYIDNCGVYKDKNGETRIVITDYKTSTIYKGEKLEKESGQLYLYAEAIRQKTQLPLDNISIRYLFMKYVNVSCMQANGKWKERQIERNQIGEKLISSIKMWLIKSGYNCDDYVDDVVINNTLDNLPQDIQDKFVITDCYVELPLTQDIIDNLKQDIIETVTQIDQKTKEYQATNNDKVFWTEINSKNEYFMNVLSGYSRRLHKPYDEYLTEKEMFENKASEEDDDDSDLLDLLAEL